MWYSDEDMEKEMIEAENKDKEVLEKVKFLCSEEYYNSIIEFMSDSTNFELSIEDKAEAKTKRSFSKWDESDQGYLFDHVYGWQSCGYTGDEYSGEIFIPLPNGQYLKFSFYM